MKIGWKKKKPFALLVFSLFFPHLTIPILLAFFLASYLVYFIPEPPVSSFAFYFFLPPAHLPYVGLWNINALLREVYFWALMSRAKLSHFSLHFSGLAGQTWTRKDRAMLRPFHTCRRDLPLYIRTVFLCMCVCGHFSPHMLARPVRFAGCQSSLSTDMFSCQNSLSQFPTEKLC